MTEATTQLPPNAQARVDEYAADLVSGRAFAVTANAHAANRFTGGHYRGPIAAREYGEVLETLGRFGRQSDRYAQAAHLIAHSLPLYGTAEDALNKVYDALFRIAKDGYDDVIGRSGPEAGRPSDHKHATTLRWALILHLLGKEISTIIDHSTAPGVGWVAQALMEREGLRVVPDLFPRLIAAQQRAAEIAAMYPSRKR